MAAIISIPALQRSVSMLNVLTSSKARVSSRSNNIPDQVNVLYPSAFEASPSSPSFPSPFTSVAQTRTPLRRTETLIISTSVNTCPDKLVKLPTNENIEKGSGLTCPTPEPQSTPAESTSTIGPSLLQREPTISDSLREPASACVGRPLMQESSSAPSATPRPLRRESTVCFESLATATLTPSERPEQTVGCRSLRRAEASLNIAFNPPSPPALVPSPRVSSSSIPTLWPTGTLVIGYQSYQRVMLFTGIPGIYIPVGSRFQVADTDALGRDASKSIVVTQKMVEEMIGTWGPVQNYTALHFQGMAVGLYAVTGDFVEHHEIGDPDEVIIIVSLCKHIFAVENSRTRKVSPKYFDRFETRDESRKRKLVELTKEEGLVIQLRDLEIVEEREEGQPLKRTRWFGPGIDRYQIVRGTATKSIKKMKRKREKRERAAMKPPAKQYQPYPYAQS